MDKETKEAIHNIKELSKQTKRHIVDVAMLVNSEVYKIDKRLSMLELNSNALMKMSLSHGDRLEELERQVKWHAHDSAGKPVLLETKPQNSSGLREPYNGYYQTGFKEGKLAGLKLAYDLTKKIHHEVHGDDCRCNWNNEAGALQALIETALYEKIAQLEKDLE